MPLGYSSGQPFGDPTGFTRSTQESELDRFNQWMRAQPWYQTVLSAVGRPASSGLAEGQQQQIEQALRANGIEIPKDFHIDEGGNLNQKSRTGRNLMIAGIAGGAALGGLGLAGLGPLGGLGASGAAGAAGAEGAAGVGAGGAAAGFLPGFVGTVAPAASVGAGAGGTLAGLGGAAAAGAAGAAGSGAAGGAARGLGSLATWLGPAIGAGASLIGSRLTNNPMANVPPELQQLLQESVRRSQYQNPLFNAVTDAAYAGLPTYAKQKKG